MVTEPADEYTFPYVNGSSNNHLGTDFSCIRESEKQLRGKKLLMVGFRT